MAMVMAIGVFVAAQVEPGDTCCRAALWRCALGRLVLQLWQRGAAGGGLHLAGPEAAVQATPFHQLPVVARLHDRSVLPGACQGSAPCRIHQP